ncbi:14910_t:CDS:2, partial [Acaulospora morrowiae]
SFENPMAYRQKPGETSKQCRKRLLARERQKHYKLELDVAIIITNAVDNNIISETDTKVQVNQEHYELERMD